MNDPQLATLRSQAAPFAGPKCQRCGHEERRGALSNMLGIMVCGLCLGMAKARHRGERG